MRLLLALRLSCLAGAALLVSPRASADDLVAAKSTTIRIAQGNFVAPQFSLDGKRLLITGERMHGVGEIAIETGAVHWHLDEARIGAHSRYLSDGSIGFQAKRAGRVRNLRIGSHGEFTERHAPPERVFARGDKIYLRTDAGVVRVGSGDRFFAPILSPDQSKIAFTGLTTGVHVYDIASKAQIRIGTGTAPSWSPDSKSLCFERTEDDGHNIVGSDLWIWREGEPARVLAHTPSLIERRPSWSPSGTQIAFDDNQGSIYITNLGPAKQSAGAAK